MVFRDYTCEPIIGYHALVVVGYGTLEDGTKYWKAKNSWGIIPGDKKRGYFYLERGYNICNITMQPIRVY